MSAKLTDHHREKQAYVYVRQSTLGQVRWHQQSTERQYALRDKALELGWRPELIRVLDGDLGVSGAHTTGRADFKRLVADVSMGEVGAVLALEASRLARSSLDWHRLIELCAMTRTAVIDEDGCYDPSEFNDALLLGMKGTLAQAELHFLRARLQGGKLNKAKKGELKFPLPVGFCHDDDGRIVKDPDEEVRGAVRLVFELFRQTGSAYGVVHQFAKMQLRFPKRAYGGAWAGKLRWGRLTHERVLTMLRNPSYAGAYVFGRYQCKRAVAANGDIHTQVHAVPMASWRVNLPDHHDGYISWEEYVRNQQRLQNNRTNGEQHVLSGAAREGLALLQGVLLCGCCGRKLTVRYKGNGGLYPLYECNWRRREGAATASCLSIRADLLDEAVSERVLAQLEPAQLELAHEAMRQLEHRERGADQQWQHRLERARYETALAERRYEEVDPSNRLVAATLEQRWNAALEAQRELEQQYAEHQNREARVATPEQRAMVLALATDFPRLWHAPTTQAKDRKRMLRLLIRDITVEKRDEARQALLHIRWQGGASADVIVELPAPIAERLRYPSDIVERIRVLARTLVDSDIAARLNADGIQSATGQSFNVSMIQWIRYRHNIPKAELKRNDELTVDNVMARFGVSRHVVYYWIDRGIVEARQLKRGSPYWITLTTDKAKALQAWVKQSTRIAN